MTQFEPTLQHDGAVKCKRRFGHGRRAVVVIDDLHASGGIHMRDAHAQAVRAIALLAAAGEGVEHKAIARAAIEPSCAFDARLLPRRYRVRHLVAAKMEWTGKGDDSTGATALVARSARGANSAKRSGISLSRLRTEVSAGRNVPLPLTEASAGESTSISCCTCVLRPPESVTCNLTAENPATQKRCCYCTWPTPRASLSVLADLGHVRKTEQGAEHRRVGAALARTQQDQAGIRVPRITPSSLIAAPASRTRPAGGRCKRVFRSIGMARPGQRTARRPPPSAGWRSTRRSRRPRCPGR